VAFCGLAGQAQTSIHSYVSSFSSKRR